MELRHALNTNQFNLQNLEYLCSLADQLRNEADINNLANKRAMLFFNQPSTRTFLSFQSACHLLGIKTSEIRDPSVSSEAKGESIEDSLRTFASYVDLIIMRSPTPGLCEKIANMLDSTPLKVPVINAGSGPDEHPTQALLDLYTLKRSMRNEGGITSKTICMVGDLKRGRTVRSLSKLLTHYLDVNLIFCSPVEFKIKQDLRETLQQANINFIETTDFKEAISQSDAVYMTRIQDEYDTQDNLSTIDTSKYHLKYDHLSILKPTCKIMHPMPRRLELDPKIDQDPRAQYWRQQRNGMWIRAALISFLLDETRDFDFAFQ